MTSPDARGHGGRGPLSPGAALALLAALPFVVFWPVTLGRAVFADGDLFEYNYPILWTAAQQWRAGRVPLWNPYIFGGTPLLAAMQAGVLYPLNALFLVLPEWLAYGESILLHYALSGVFMALYLRTLRVRPAAGLVGALVFMLSGFPLASLGLVSTVRTLPWLPLILFAFERWRSGGGIRFLALGGAATGLMILAGHPQIPFYASGVLVTYALWHTAVAAPAERPRLLLGLVAILTLGAGLSAAQVAPTLAALPEYMRPRDGGYDYFAWGSLAPATLVNLAFPQLSPERTIYLGLLPLALAWVGIRLTGGRDSHRSYFVWLAFGAFVLALGDTTPLHPWLFRVPIYRNFTCPIRHLYEVTFAAGVLAAFGADALLDGDRRQLRRPLIQGLWGLALLLAASGCVVWAFRGGDPANEVVRAFAKTTLASPAIVRRIPYWIVSLALLLMLIRKAPSRAWLLAVAVCVAADLVSFGGRIYRLYDPSVYTRRPASLAALGAGGSPFRILALERSDRLEQSKELLARNYNSVLGLEAVSGFDSLMLAQVFRASGGIMRTFGLIFGEQNYERAQFRRFIDLLNTRYLTLPPDVPHTLDPARYRPVFRSDAAVVYENAAAAPRFQVVHAAVRVTPERALSALSEGELDGQPWGLSTALVEPPGESLPASAREAATAATIAVERMEPGDVEITADNPAPGILVHSTNYARGWKASVDGAGVPVFRVDGLVQGVALPAGRHRVRFFYRPAAFIAGLWVSSLTLLALAGAAATDRARPQV